jgi:hypothetical protein
MLPWTAAYVADVANGVRGEGAANNVPEGVNEGVSLGETSRYDVEKVMREARENARSVYGV